MSLNIFGIDYFNVPRIILQFKFINHTIKFKFNNYSRYIIYKINLKRISLY